jgi:hypothetical protein
VGDGENRRSVVINPPPWIACQAKRGVAGLGLVSIKIKYKSKKTKVKDRFKKMNINNR